LDYREKEGFPFGNWDLGIFPTKGKELGTQPSKIPYSSGIKRGRTSGTNFPFWQFLFNWELIDYQGRKRKGFSRNGN